jgi:hypothetical protein
MIVSRRLILAWFAACALPLCAHAQDEAPPKPDFSGRWRMVKEKSDFASAQMPDIIIRVVDQKGSTMNVHTVQTTGKKTTSADVSYFIDGSEAKNVINGHDAVSRTFWDGPALTVRTSLKLSNGDDQVIEDRWELSDEGQTLTTTSHISTPQGGTEMKLVCTKQKVGG